MPFFGKEMGEAVKSYIKKNWAALIVFAVTFILCGSIIYLDANTTQTITSFSIDDYEPGQISDRTIIASKSLPADGEFPVEIEEGEKIIKKGFEIKPEQYLKLKKMAASPSYIDYRAFADNILFIMLISALAFLLFSSFFLGRKAELKELILEGCLFVIVFFMTCFGDKAPVFQGVFRLPVIIPSSICVYLVTILFGQISGLYFTFLISSGLTYNIKLSLVTVILPLDNF